MYESPIEVIYSQVRTQLVEEEERQILKAVHDVGVNVDRDELIKALEYDRDQYEKGFEDGKKSVWVETEKRLPEKCGAYWVIAPDYKNPIIARYLNNIRIVTLDDGINRPGFVFGDSELENVLAWLDAPPYGGRNDVT